jgi:gentisate 1,2-dioxygenase
MQPTTAAELAAVTDLDVLREKLAPLSHRAGWNKAEPSLWPQPRTSFLPAQWRWDRAKAGLDVAGGLISTELAERRNLFNVNPMQGNVYNTVRTLVSAYQMILPGETARSHRHSANALRFVLDVPEGCYTVVDGMRIDMRPGDVLLTPNWCWHGHGSEGDRPGYWVDYLDVPLVHLLEPMFLEHWPQGFQAPGGATRDSPFVFPWEDTVARLAAAVPDAQGCRRIELGAPAMATTALFMERIPAGVAQPARRSTESRICTIVSGRGTTRIGDAVFHWQRGDTLAIPSWHALSHAAEDEAVIFTVSDRPVLEKLGFLREADG